MISSNMFELVKLTRVETKTYKYNHYRLLNILIWKYISLNPKKNNPAIINNIKRLYSIGLSDLKTYLGLKDNKQIVDLIQKISKSYIKFSDSEGTNLGFSSMVSSEAYIENDSLFFNFSDYLAKLIDSERVKSVLCFNGTRMFKNKFAKDLYYICKESSDPETEWIDVGDFRELLAVPDKKIYNKFKNVGSKIISPSIAEINTLSDLKLEVEYITDDKGIKSVRFKIENKEPLILSPLVTWEKPKDEENVEEVEDKDTAGGDLTFQAKQFIKGADEETLELYKIDFIEMIKGKKMVYQRFEKYGYNDVLIKNVFLQFIRDNVLSKVAS